MNPLDYMLRARSVAIVGASDRPGSVGSETVRQITEGGFTGSLHLVHPHRTEIAARPVVASLEDVVEPVDLVVLAVGNDHLESEMEKVVKTGARSVVMFASSQGEARAGGSLRDRVAMLATESGIPICGGNGMGFVNLSEGLRVCGFHQPARLTPGGITFLSHSGSMFSAMLHNRRRLRFNLVVSTGLEANTTMDRYLDWALDDDRTRIVALFLETVRNPPGFRAALARAETMGVPVVALKVGESSRARAAVATHSGALAGEDSVYRALFRAHGVHQVATMDEMADTLELLGAGRGATTTGLGSVHDSGGERALLIDAAERVGVHLPQVGSATTRRLAGILDSGLEPANPVDAWGTGRDAIEVFVESMKALAEDPVIGAVAFCVDLTEEVDPDQAYSGAAMAAHRATDKPVMVIANLASAVDVEQAERLRAAGIPVLEGTETALRAVGHLFDRVIPRPAGDGTRMTRPSDPSSGIAGEAAALAVLDAYGIRVPRVVEVDTEPEALAAAQRVGYPVVLKTRGVAHKTEVGGVALGLADPAMLSDAYRRMAERLGPEMLVCQHIGPGVELAMGMVADPQFGPVVVLSAGGTLIELLADKVTMLPPVDVAGAARALARLRVSGLLAGHRGHPVADFDDLAEVIARFSELAMDASGSLAAIDVNPLVVGPGGAAAVDALMVGL